MKMKLLAVAVSAAVVVPGMALADGPTVYGKANVTLEKVNEKNVQDANKAVQDLNNFQLNSNASRLGVKGDAKINDQLKAIYTMEWEVSVDGTSGTDLGKRNRSVGLAGNFGTVEAGMFDSPLKASQGKVDQFNDLPGDLKFVILGDERPSNIVQYTSPAIKGVQAKAAVMQGEQLEGGDATKYYNHGLADAYSASVSYSDAMFYAALAHDENVASKYYSGLKAVAADGTGGDYASSTKPFDTTRLVGQVTSGPVQVGGIYSTGKSHETDFDGDLKQKGYLLSAAYTIGQTVAKAQVGKTTFEETTTKGVAKADNDAKTMSVGVDQKLSAQTLVMAYYTKVSYKVDGSDEQEKDNLGVGLVHSF